MTPPRYDKLRADLEAMTRPRSKTPGQVARKAFISLPAETPCPEAWEVAAKAVLADDMGENATKIIENYRNLHVQQHQELHKQRQRIAELEDALTKVLTFLENRFGNTEDDEAALDIGDLVSQTINPDPKP
jgi:hypothetical protein